MGGKMLALVSYKLPDEICAELENLGYGCVLLKDHPHLDAPVASHPDMLFSVLDSGEVLADLRYLRAYPELSELKIKFRTSSKSLDKKYPLDIAFDALIFNAAVYGRLDFIAPEILENRKMAVNVSQGYTLCSTLVTDKVAITADEGIYTALCENGVNTLKISPRGIALDGYDCGFIGGASVYEPNSNTVIFFGDVTRHPDFEKLDGFLKENGHGVCYFDDLPLKDYGGAKLIKIK